MPPQDLPTLPFDKHGYWFVTDDIIAHQPELDKGVANGTGVLANPPIAN